ncbi:O-antigen ligase family protein [Adhaeribacter swui]|uniref:O-antigen ligase family protein n=1 Tax=Adhaeribacter swui TaxID=2086471 RepID=A0A7G7GCV7_9BACT|nr:O-antigen ligase family protein [Adhaeribacter swui]QNF34991.1 O-antigen ligase family protein [Adhaeribacter swui]
MIIRIKKIKNLKIKTKYRAGLTIQKSEGLLLLFSIYCFLCFQITELKVANIKFNELISLLVLPYFLIKAKSINRYLLYFLTYFAILLLLTFIKNLTQEFYLDYKSLSILRWPYFISLSRFIEYLSCFTFALITYKSYNYFKAKGYTKKYITEKLLWVNAYFSLILIVFYILYYLGILSYHNATIIYDAAPYLPEPILRLRAYFIEGGPLGLFYAFLFCITSIVNKRAYFLKSVFILVIILAKSKAGIIAVVGWLFYIIYLKFRSKSITKYIIFLIIVPVFLATAVKVADNYVETYQQTAVLLKDRADDNNFVMGRTAAFYIVPNMIYYNPVFGIGLGNYSLVRNDPRYLDILPPVNDWDLPGLGGLITLLVENGIIGLSLFLAIVFLIHRKYAKYSLLADRSIVLFLLICCLGVQLYFLYIWFLIGFAITSPDDLSQNLHVKA